MYTEMRVIMGDNNWSYSKIYKEIKPYEEYDMYDVAWHDGMSAADGHIGVITSCAPLNDSFIFQNVEYIMPSEEPRYVPLEVEGQLDEARQSVINMDDTWDIHNRKRTNMYCHHPGHQLRVELCRSAGITDTNALISEAVKHPQMTQNDDINITDYERYTDFNRSEIVVKYKADGRTITKRTFASLTDDVVITEITGAKDFIVNISVDDFEAMHKFGMDKNKQATSERGMKYSRFVKDDIVGVVAHYPSFEGSELANGGFAGATRFITDGIVNMIELNKSDKAYTCIDNIVPIIQFNKSDKIILITYLDWTDKLGRLEDFQAECGSGSIFDTELVRKCFAKVNDSLGTADKVFFNSKEIYYDAAIKEHSIKSAERYNRVSLHLYDNTDYISNKNNKEKKYHNNVSKADGNSKFTIADNEDRCNIYNRSTNEELLDKQKEVPDIFMPLLERIYNNARYGLMSGAGYTAPRLNGPGVGEWNLMWRNAYTMDANVNIQVSGINSGNMYEAGVGYIWFVLRQLKDWEINAKKVYGMKNALLAPINTDGQRAMMVEYDINYPFQYWNTGASWMILPIAEWVDCYGDVSITTTDQKIIKQYNKEVFNVKKDILMPLLQKTYNFWEQLCTPEYYTDIEGNARYEKGKTHLFTGEKYLIIPSFSPENKPLGYKSAITANASMDIAAAKDIIAMYIDMENELQNEGYKERIKKAEKLNNELPDYQYDESGAIREWAMKEYQENSAHRHISHLYCAWPAYQTQHNNKLANACRQAILNRNKENSGKDDTASHGWIHKALVEARLKNSEEVYNILNMLVHSDIFYSTLFTDHNTNRAKGVACTDTLYGIAGIINEMLVYSDKNTVELLPALSSNIPAGNISGLLTRAGVRVDYLSWDVDKRNVKADLTALRDTSFNLVLNNKAYIGEENESKCVAVQLKKGERYCFMG